MSRPQLNEAQQLELNKQLIEDAQHPDRIETCRKLLERGANPNFTDEDNSVLGAAIMAGNNNAPMLDLLLDKGATVGRIFDSSIPHFVAAIGAAELMKVLHRRGVNIFALDEYGHTPLDYIRKETGLGPDKGVKDLKGTNGEGFMDLFAFLEEVRPAEDRARGATNSQAAASSAAEKNEDDGITYEIASPTAAKRALQIRGAPSPRVENRDDDIAQRRAAYNLSKLASSNSIDRQ